QEGPHPRLLVLDIAVPKRDVGAHLVRIVSEEIVGLANEALASHDAVVLNVPKPRPLFREHARASLEIDLTFSLRLRSNRIVPQEEAKRKHLATGKLHVVPTGPYQVHLLILLLPGLDLHGIELAGSLVILKRLAQILAALVIIVDRSKIQRHKLDGVVAEPV